jgi:hypothetical protein
MSRKPLGGFDYQPQSLHGWVRIPFTSKVITCRLFETPRGAFVRWEKATWPQVHASNLARLAHERAQADQLFREINQASARERQLAEAWAARRALDSPSSRQAGPAALAIGDGYQPGPAPASAGERGLAGHGAPVPDWQLIRAAEAGARQTGMRASMPDRAAAGTPEYDADLARWGDGRGIGPDGPETAPAAGTGEAGIEAG